MLKTTQHNDDYINVEFMTITILIVVEPWFFSLFDISMGHLELVLNLKCSFLNMKISKHDMYFYGKDYIWTIIAEDAKSDLLIPILLPFKISIFVVRIIVLNKFQ